jgi:hypothetical protein
MGEILADAAAAGEDLGQGRGDVGGSRPVDEVGIDAACEFAP